MVSKKKYLIGAIVIATIIFVAAGGGLCLEFWRFGFGNGSVGIAGEEVKYSVNYGNYDLWKRIFDEPGIFEMPKDVFAVVLPHHLITATELTKFYRGLAEVIDPDVVVLVGPNHFGSGTADIQVCNCSYETFDGMDLKTDRGLLGEILEVVGSGENNDDGIYVTNESYSDAIEISRKVTVLDNESFKKEHSIFAHVNFVKHFFKDAEILPIILKQKMIRGNVSNKLTGSDGSDSDDVGENKLNKLVEFLDKNLSDNSFFSDGKVLVVASIDFSHYLTKEVADAHDKISFDAISRFAYDEFSKLDLDSPEAIYVVSKLAGKRGFKNVDLINNTNSQDFFHYTKLEETTSHEFITFSK